MGYIGGFIGFGFAMLVFGGLGLVFLPTLPATIPALMFVFSACVIGIVLARAVTPALGVLIGIGPGLSRLAALIFAGVIITLIIASWQPVISMLAEAWFQATALGAVSGGTVGGAIGGIQGGVSGGILGGAIAGAPGSVVGGATGSAIGSTAGAVSGSVAGSVIGASLWLVTGFLLALVGLIAVTIAQLVLTGISYVTAAVIYNVAGPSVAESEARGACAGVNAAMNLLLGIAIIPRYLVEALGWITGGALTFITLGGILVASIIPFRRVPPAGIVLADERTAIAWLLCLLPTAWLVELLGLALFLISLIVHATVGFFVPMMSMTGISLRADTASVVLTGGIAANLNPAPAYNIGTFTFVRTITPALIPVYNDATFVGRTASLLNHEIGHQLNLAAYGSAFNLVGFVDEWLSTLLNLFKAGYPIYGEDLASTNDPTPLTPPPGPLFPTPLSMWVI